MTLHIIKTDILLHVLGGFAPSPDSVLTQRSYPPALIKQLYILSQRKRIEYGELSRLAMRWRQKRANLAVYIWRMRRRKELVPSYWWDVIAAVDPGPIPARKALKSLNNLPLTTDTAPRTIESVDTSTLEPCK